MIVSRRPEPNDIPPVEMYVASTSNLREVAVPLSQGADGFFNVGAVALDQCFDTVGSSNPTAIQVRVKGWNGRLPLISFADDRIQVDRTDALLFVDDLPVGIESTPFNLLVDLAQHLDEPRPLRTILSSVWDIELSEYPGGFKSAQNLVASNLSRIRRVFGDQLGDRKTGAIRSKRTAGRYAVSRLAKRSTH